MIKRNVFISPPKQLQYFWHWNFNKFAQNASHPFSPRPRTAIIGEPRIRSLDLTRLVSEPYPSVYGEVAVFRGMCGTDERNGLEKKPLASRFSSAVELLTELYVQGRWVIVYETFVCRPCRLQRSRLLVISAILSSSPPPSYKTAVSEWPPIRNQPSRIDYTLAYTEKRDHSLSDNVYYDDLGQFSPISESVYTDRSCCHVKTGRGVRASRSCDI